MEQVNLGYLCGTIGTVAGLIGAIVGTYVDMRKAKQGKDLLCLRTLYKTYGGFYNRKTSCSGNNN